MTIVPLLIVRLQNIIRLLGRLDQRLTEIAPSGKPLTSTCTVDGQQALTREPPVCLFVCFSRYDFRFMNQQVQETLGTLEARGSEFEMLLARK